MNKFALNQDLLKSSSREIEADKFKLTVLVDMFGRETPVEVEFDQIEKL